MSISVSRPEQLPAVRTGHRVALGAGGAVVALALVKLLATVALAGRYGFHRDELYYLQSARHLAFGYVDFPSLTPLLARLDILVFGTSLVGLRLLSALAGTAIILLTARMARELGGGPFTQFLAALAILTAPMFLGANAVFETVTFDQLAWVVVLFLVVRQLNTGNGRLWLPIGLAFGLGLNTKYTILALGLGLVIGFLLTEERAQLRTRWPWLALAIALLLLAPNLVWQAGHNWPSLGYLDYHHGRIAHDTSRLAYILEQIILAGPAALPLLFLGLYSLLRSRPYRCLGIACISVELSLFLAGGKSYYAGPIYPLLLAAGAVSLGSMLGRRARLLRTGAAGLLLLGGLALLPLSLPVLPAQTMANSGIWKVRTDYADMVGWPELVVSVARVYDRLPAGQRASTVILASNYGEAGAINELGPRYGLPQALSGHLTFYYWKPRHVDARTVIALGMDRASLAPLFRGIRQVGTVRNSLGLQNEEYGGPIYLCTRPRISLDRAWPSLQHFD